jgi:hypothetical protein
MPQPLRIGSSVQFGPDTLLRRRELAAEIGNVCANWNLIEHDLMSLYALLMGDYLPNLHGFAPPTHPVAYQVFDALNAFNPRVDLLEKLLVWRASEGQVKQFRETIRPTLRKRFAERSEIVHGIWGTCDEYPDGLILIPTYGHQMNWVKRDFQEVSRRILDQQKLMGALLRQLYEERKAASQSKPGLTEAPGGT